MADYWLEGADSLSGSERMDEQIGIETPFNESISVSTARDNAILNTERRGDDGQPPLMI